MSDSHAKLPKLFWAQLALAAIIGIIFLYTLLTKSEEHGTEVEKIASVTKNLEPVGAVSTKDAKAPDSAKARSGEEVYQASCMACHSSGVANAPKPDDKAAWESRVATGLDAMIKIAIDGKGAMPARGGNPAITDEEIKAVILYMTKKAGFDLSSTKKAEPSNSTMAETNKSVEKSVEKIMPATTAVVPVAPSAPAAPVAPNTMEEAPAKPATPGVISEPKTEVATTPTVDKIKGEKVYKSACFACHEAGVAGSPKLGDIATWTARIATGNDALYSAAINGKGIMPPKGGNMGLSDDDVKAAVDYMIAQSQ